jgi:hypothetical protein
LCQPFSPQNNHRADYCRGYNGIQVEAPIKMSKLNNRDKNGGKVHLLQVRELVVIGPAIDPRI